MSREIQALKVAQWLDQWNEVDFDEASGRAKPEPHYYLFTMAASSLRRLSGVYKRSAQEGEQRSGIQRRHDPERSGEINRFIQYGFPWSSLSNTKRQSGQFNEFKKPGWLPTAIIVNILSATSERRGKQVHKQDLIQIKSEEDKNSARILLPEGFDNNWKPQTLSPIEVIDGQHRLWAFDNEEISGEYDLPIVAFYNLDISWQAYLFWTINIKPKRINSSLAFDLYPLLRTEDWLERFEGHSIYRETRAQELVESMWSYPESPWYQKINMLGESGKAPMVTQAAWVKSLMATFIKSWQGRGVTIGGLFGEYLPWSRIQQAAFLISAWQSMYRAVETSSEEWIQSLEEFSQQSLFDQANNVAFYGSGTHLNTNIGNRGFLYMVNDLCYVSSDDLGLEDWEIENNSETPNNNLISEAISSLGQTQIFAFLEELANVLVQFDWRTASALPESAPEDERLRKQAMRGGTGYKTIRQYLLKHCSERDGKIGHSAKKAIDLLGY